jgi:hypothetical protein
MKSSTSLLAALVAAGLGAACAGHTKYDPFIVPQARIYGSVKTIALAPMCACSGTPELRKVDPSRGKFDSLVTTELTHAGFAVVPAAASDSIWRRVTDSLGGLFNSATGEPDTARLNIARALTMRELQARFHADAWLHSHIVLAAAKFNGGEAKWDGASQTYQSFGKKFLTALFGGGTYGKTPALSLRVDLEDIQGKDLYGNQGGLQLYEVPSGRDFRQIPLDQLYADPVRNANAVHLALAPLVTRGQESGAK